MTVDGFYIGKYPVAQKEWREEMDTNPSFFKGDSHPVERVSWYATLVFLNKLSIKEGLTPVYRIGGFTNPNRWGGVPDSRNSTWDAVSVNWLANGYRLPTEAEWEYAARGGRDSKGFIYAGSNNIDEVAWYFRNSGDERLTGDWDIDKVIKKNCRTHPVGQKKPNELGLYDMSGNVWNLCWDRWGSYAPSSCTNPTGPSDGLDRIARGGGWGVGALYCTVSRRGGGNPSALGLDIGFRFVRRAE